MNRPTRLVICGARGRMGQMLIDCAAEDPQLEVVGEVDLGDDLGSVIDRCDAIIEFALADATLATAEQAAAHGKPLVIGTTGHSADQVEKIRSVLAPVPVVWAANFGMGVNVLFWATQRVAEIVGPHWQAEVCETHHTAKKDAPSGTAKRLQDILREIRGGDIPAHSLRIGDVVGDHTVTFGTTGERLELTHRAGSRSLFARGALQAAKWTVTQPAGLYDMQDVLGLR